MTKESKASQRFPFDDYIFVVAVSSLVPSNTSGPLNPVNPAGLRSYLKRGWWGEPRHRGVVFSSALTCLAG